MYIIPFQFWTRFEILVSAAAPLRLAAELLPGNVGSSMQSRTPDASGTSFPMCTAQSDGIPRDGYRREGRRGSRLVSYPCRHDLLIGRGALPSFRRPVLDG